MEELRPCPFCGKEVELIQSDKEPYDWMIIHRCSNGKISGFLNWSGPREQVIKFWNRGRKTTTTTPVKTKPDLYKRTSKFC